MGMQITVVVKSIKIRDKDFIKPVNDTAKLFYLLIGSKSFSMKQLDVIERLGFKVVFEGY